MTDVRELLSRTRTVLVIDWPDRDVPDTLARHGFVILAREGRAPDEYNAYEVVGGEVQSRHVGRPPDRAELVYAHRPIDELAGIADEAARLGARAVWIQSGLDETGTRHPHGCWLPAAESHRARTVVEAAGLEYVEAPYIADAVREFVSVGGYEAAEASA